MDALKFIEERNRMCDYYRGGNALSGCAECPAFQMTCVPVRSVTAEYIAAVEQWSKEHPRKTRQDVFLEQYPEACVLENGCLGICPNSISSRHRDEHGECIAVINGECIAVITCDDCRREFWTQEVE